MKTTVQGREITLGSDVEAALFHVEKGMYIPATEFNTPYSRDNRLVWEDGTGSYHRDNILVEFQTPVVENWAELEAVARQCALKLNKEYRAIGCNLVLKPVVNFMLDSMVETPEAQEIGCDPDIDAYTGEEMRGPEAVDMEHYRVGSGHIHIGGVSDMTFESKKLLVRWLDVLLGLPLAKYEAAYHPKAYVRRRWYGQAGRFRVKPYGIEYRTPSNAWVHAAVDEYGGADQSDNILLAIDLTDKGLLPEKFNLSSVYVAAAINGPSMGHFYIDYGQAEGWAGRLERHRFNLLEAMKEIRLHV